MRTHVVADAEIARRAKKLTGLRTNRAVAEEGLRLLVELHAGLIDRGGKRLMRMKPVARVKPGASVSKMLIKDRRRLCIWMSARP
ncbi:MAG: type II toxin-antitoxin system VapB family antitoxin [Chloroflexi bacterium]|nr:type II toxin-antitoxin system VapB family antitoxin [Chloroflexota bacterium]